MTSEAKWPVIGCPTCHHLIVLGEACEACAIRAAHKPDCKYRIAATGDVAIECEHGRDVCPVCDPCTCGGDGERAHG